MTFRESVEGPPGFEIILKAIGGPVRPTARRSVPGFPAGLTSDSSRPVVSSPSTARPSRGALPPRSGSFVACEGRSLLTASLPVSHPLRGAPSSGSMLMTRRTARIWSEIPLRRRAGSNRRAEGRDDSCNTAGEDETGLRGLAFFDGIFAARACRTRGQSGRTQTTDQQFDRSAGPIPQHEQQQRCGLIGPEDHQ